ncbi:DUF2244 domain-containing protein [Seongchinamella sediminis]|uniref:DUF2244 domain-containing protein n=1 Tax=Seongchinamella sediminis TaxID=2283635 RepID=A0A3L7E1M4_9GAMM|nr:DUF2244 domain-containing protein [Seongchinamella sediminis]RLQ23807.1 DUF2244 domain-containing protein [Seongchinamella sediminis]
MVTSSHDREAGTLMIVARPNHSSSWRANLYALMAVAVPSLGAAIGFSLLGAWPILPFAGLELLALGGALYYVNWKLQYRHVITLSDDSVQIEKGHYHPRQCWRFARQHTGLSITPERRPGDSPVLTIHDSRESVGIGEFLGPAEARELIALLRQELRVNSTSPREGREF